MTVFVRVVMDAKRNWVDTLKPKFALTRKGADLPAGVGYEMLERYEGKLSRTVLR
jgi:hypothetical protein